MDYLAESPACLPLCQPPGNPAGIYLSVPYCRQKCTYCNFASAARPVAELPRYLAALEREISHSNEFWQRAGLRRRDPVAADSIYLGGGTPGLLSGTQLTSLLAAVRASFEIAHSAEITLEASPENITAETAAAFASGKINRVSMGVQSMVTQELRAVGRMHDAMTVAAAFAALRSAGIRDISVDLIAGLPHQSEQSWERSLQEVLEREPTHISVYMLEVDQESRLGNELLDGGTRYRAGAVPSEEQVVEFYTHAIDRLAQAGFLHYEISNFARPGRQSRHNGKYWSNANYFGFGVEAHSYDGERRWANVGSIDEYLQRMAEDHPPIEQWRALGNREKLEERFFLGLRRREGISLAAIEYEFGHAVREKYKKKIREFCQAGWLEETGNRLRLTDRGVLFSNEVFAGLLL